MATTLYHLVQVPVWSAAKAEGTLYKPPTYDQVIHKIITSQHVNVHTTRSVTTTWSIPATRSDLQIICSCSVVLDVSVAVCFDRSMDIQGSGILQATSHGLDAVAGCGVFVRTKWSLHCKLQP